MRLFSHAKLIYCIATFICLFTTIAQSQERAQAADDYQTYCSSCHGERGNGQGALTHLIDPTPIPHQNSDYIRSLSNEYLFSLLKNGGESVGKSSMMTAWDDVLSDDQINALVLYLKTLAK